MNIRDLLEWTRQNLAFASFRYVLTEWRKLSYRTKLEGFCIPTVMSRQPSFIHFPFFLNVIQFTYPSHQPWISDGCVCPSPSQCSMAQSQTSTFEAYNHVKPISSPWTPPKVGRVHHHPILSGVLMAASAAGLHECRPSSSGIACIRHEWPQWWGETGRCDKQLEVNIR